jgi:hypothetical protein
VTKAVTTDGWVLLPSQSSSFRHDLFDESCEGQVIEPIISISFFLSFIISSLAPASPRNERPPGGRNIPVMKVPLSEATEMLRLSTRTVRLYVKRHENQGEKSSAEGEDLISECLSYLREGGVHYGHS